MGVSYRISTEKNQGREILGKSQQNWIMLGNGTPESMKMATAFFMPEVKKPVLLTGTPTNYTKGQYLTDYRSTTCAETESALTLVISKQSPWRRICKEDWVTGYETAWTIHASTAINTRQRTLT